MPSSGNSVGREKRLVNPAIVNYINLKTERLCCSTGHFQVALKPRWKAVEAGRSWKAEQLFVYVTCQHASGKLANFRLILYLVVFLQPHKRSLSQKTMSVDFCSVQFSSIFWLVLGYRLHWFMFIGKCCYGFSIWKFEYDSQVNH